MARRLPSFRIDVLWCLALTIVFEAAASFFHFVLGLETTRDTGWLRTWTFGLRIHHGYFGVLLILIGFLGRSYTWRRWCWIIGLALILSDLAHHFLVLWPITGRSDFDLVYPR
ncbi:MAG TPA: hypothetical protein VMS17_08300 [Gemmataceae bacterium]|nr:hypothetical protein [Gemmataceae bacterium]